jgi:2-acylglycerol O-acyltransferase 2
VTVDAALKNHPLAGALRSGDVAGKEHKSANMLNVTSGRRRQTAAVLWLSLLTGPIINFSIIGFCLWFVPYFVYVFLAYMAWVFYDAKTAPRPAFHRRSDKWRGNAVFKHFADYFPIRLVKHNTEHHMDPSKNYLFCYHPHGVISAGVLAIASAAAGFDELFRGITLSINTLGVNWYMPVIHEHANLFSYSDASKEAIAKCLSHGPGFSTLLVTGGAKESMTAHPYTSKVVLKTRAGFIKVALRAGASLVPIWGFGENNIFENLAVNSPAVLAWQRNVQKLLTFAPVMVAGRGVFSYSGGMLPHRRPITVVFGAPIAVEKDPDPSPEKVAEVHEKYKAAVLELFNSLKDIYDPKAEQIEFI